MNKEGSQKNKLKDKKTDNNVQGFISIRWHILCQEKKEKDTLALRIS